jgi:hypothetical protein
LLACSLACLLACLPCLLACPACLLACLLARLFACLLACSSLELKVIDSVQGVHFGLPSLQTIWTALIPSRVPASAASLRYFGGLLGWVSPSVPALARSGC